MSAPTPRDPARMCKAAWLDSDGAMHRCGYRMDAHNKYQHQSASGYIWPIEDDASPKPTADPTPVPPHLSDAERALWEKADAATPGPWVPLVIVKGGLVEFPDAADHFVVGSAPVDGEGSVLAITGPTKTNLPDESRADTVYIAACSPDVIHSLLALLSSERAAAEKLRNLVRGWVVTDENGEPLRFGGLLPECVGGLAYYVGAVDLPPARTLDEAITAASAPSTETPR